LVTALRSLIESSMAHTAEAADTTPGGHAATRASLTSQRDP